MSFSAILWTTSQTLTGALAVYVTRPFGDTPKKLGTKRPGTKDLSRIWQHSDMSVIVKGNVRRQSSLQWSFYHYMIIVLPVQNVHG